LHGEKNAAGVILGIRKVRILEEKNIIGSKIL
jgi:hypothetical protein